MKLFRKYISAARIKVCAGCTKVEGEPERCSVCPPAFPTIHKHKGVLGRAMPKSRVSELVKLVFAELEAQGFVEPGQAALFSSKSLRTGGVSEAAANATLCRCTFTAS